VTAGHVTFSKQYLICRFKRHHESKEPSFTARAYKRREQSCDVAFSLYIYSDHVELYTSGSHPTNHSHLLDESDANKRNSFLRGLAQQDIAKGYAPAAVIGLIQGHRKSEVRERLAAAGGTYLTRQDVINSSAAWRLANPNALFVTRDAADNVSLQAKAAFEKLDNLKWLSSPINAILLDRAQGHGIVFA
jgi:hypothetical protein